MQRECGLAAYWHEERYPVLFFFVLWYSCSIIWYPGLWRIYCKHVKEFLNYFGFVNIRSQKLRDESHRLSLNNVSHYCFSCFGVEIKLALITLCICILSMRKKRPGLIIIMPTETCIQGAASTLTSHHCMLLAHSERRGALHEIPHIHDGASVRQNRCVHLWGVSHLLSDLGSLGLTSYGTSPSTGQFCTQE